MPKLTDYGPAKDGARILGFLCPGCGDAHTVRVGAPSRPNWEWNRSMESPTFRPSVLVFDPMPDGSRRTRCHFFVTDGRIEYCGDSPHQLAGQTVDLPETDG